MQPREIVRALLQHEIPERMGVYEHWWEETLRDVWPSQGYPEGATPEDVFQFDIENCGGWFNTEPFHGRIEVLEETDEWILRKDGRGASLRYWKGKSGTPEHVDFEVTDWETWKRYREPLLTLDPSRLGDIEDVRKRLAAAREKGRFTVYGQLYVFELLRATMGDQNFLPALLLEPDLIRDFCQVYLDHYRLHFDYLFREAGLPDGIFIYEDLGFSNGLFCSPATLRELILPFERALVEFLKDYGLPVILHSCGDVRKAVPIIIEAGYDCLQPMEAKAGCDVVELAREYGDRLAFMGNINVVELTTNDKARVEAEVLRKVRAMREMRVPYFFHSDHSIPPNIRYETYLFALELFRENRNY
ncbi:MAG: hypothetical protein AMXMBFR61_19830 [Fimbriimonadales bacterium]